MRDEQWREQFEILGAKLDEVRDAVLKRSAPTFEQLAANVGPLPSTALASAESPPMEPQAIDWSRFLPTPWMIHQYDDAKIPPVAALVSGEIRSSKWFTYAAVFRVDKACDMQGTHGMTILARTDGGFFDDGQIVNGSSCARHSVVIRHADGRWADNFHPGGPCNPKCGKVYLNDPFYGGLKSPRGDNVSSWGALVGGVYLDFCSEFCRDRAKAKAAKDCNRTGPDARPETIAHPIGELVGSARSLGDVPEGRVDISMSGPDCGADRAGSPAAPVRLASLDRNGKP